MTEIINCTIHPKPISYDIIIEHGLLKGSDLFFSIINKIGSRFAIITTDNVAPIIAEPLQKCMTAHGLKVHLFTFPSGEQQKSRETKQILEDKMLAAGLGRDTCLITIGGGVAMDLAGFIAATYCRGIPLVMAPTTFLGMVDASIGGKTGVNVPQGKNMIGVTYQPKCVLIDPDTLKTLPKQEIKNGIVEMIKHGLIADADYYDFIDNNFDALVNLNPDIVKKAITGSCHIKKSIVEQDEKEAGKRTLLNFGHTVGHALEKLSNYSLPHGEAVAIGLIAECHIAMQMGFLEAKTYERIRNLLLKHKLTGENSIPFQPQAILDAMTMDKKSLNGKPRFVMINAIGSPLPFNGAFCSTADPAVIINALKQQGLTSYTT